jgi:hypothetical protein
MKTHKTCKQCGVNHEIVMFSKKGKYKYCSRCRICNSLTGFSYSIYRYPTAEMQKMAELNHRRLRKDMRVGKPTCIKCDNHTTRRGTLCPDCKVIAKRAKYKQRDKKRSHTKSQRRIENLAGCYVRKLIFPHSMRKEFNISNTDIPQDLIDLKRQQILLLRTIK